MVILCVFGLVLLVAVLFSELAERSVLSLAVLFLIAGFCAGPAVLGLIQSDPLDPAAEILTELALFSVLFTDGMRVDLKKLRADWQLPGLALFVGLPLTMLITGLLAHWLLGLRWAEAFLIGAALSPTDPVLAAAIIGRKSVAQALRSLLNIESGMNDGLALPMVLILIWVVQRESVPVLQIIGSLAGGVAFGVFVPWAAIRLARIPYLGVSEDYRPLKAVAIGVLLWAGSHLLHVNSFLAAFAGAITFAKIAPEHKESFESLGDLLAELLKLSALLLFGTFLSWKIFRELSLSSMVFIIVAVVLVRPLALSVTWFSEQLRMREWIAAMWFGPRGFASVLFALLILHSGIPRAHDVFAIIALVVTLSIVLHSTSDVPLAKWLARGDSRPEPTGKLVESKEA